jgi:hypothetical protein
LGFLIKSPIAELPAAGILVRSIQLRNSYNGFMSKEQVGGGNDDIPPWALRAAERAGQRTFWQALGAPLVRAGSPAYIQLGWTRAQLPDAAAKLLRSRSVVAAGDREVAAWKKFAGLWPRAHVLTANRQALEALSGDDPNVRPMAAYITNDDRIHVGILPEHKKFGSLPGNHDRATLAFRQGHNASRWVMGVMRGDGELLVPEDLHILGGEGEDQWFYPIRTLTDRLPETPLV